MSGSAEALELPQIDEFVDFLLEICRLLMASGCSSNRVEHLLKRLAGSFGYEVETIALPTGVWITARRAGAQKIDLTRIEKWSVDLDRIALISDIVEGVAARRLGFLEARKRLYDLKLAKAPYSEWLTVLAGGGASAALVASYKGSALEVILSVPIGCLVQYLNKYFFVEGERRYLADFMGAVVVALYALICKQFHDSIDVPRMIVGGIIILVPGLVLVNSVHEMAQKNLVSGAAKAFEAAMITASLACGVIFVLGLWLIF